MALLLAFLQAWVLIFLFLKLLESLTAGRLSSVLSHRNIRLHFCFISIHTSHFNTLLHSFSRRRKSLLTYWYSLGVLFGFCGLLLSLLLLLSNISLSLLDLLRPLPPAHPPPPHHLPFHPSIPHSLSSGPSHHFPPPPFVSHPRLHHALSLASPRAPQARVPFMHLARRPWFLPSSFWARLSPRDHAVPHALALSTRIAAAQRRFAFPSRRFHPAGFYDIPAPPRHRRPRGPGGPGGRGGRYGHRHPPPPGADGHRPPHRPPCHRPPQTPWDPFRKGPQPALPAPAISGHNPTLTIGHIDPDDTAADDEAEEKDLIDNGEKSSITISWRNRKLLSVSDKPRQEDDGVKSSARVVEPPSQDHNSTTSSSSSSSSSSGNAGHQHQQPPQSSKNAFLTPLVPGVTVPAGDLWYMIGAVMIAAVVHELGHALAAGMQNGQVSGIGVFLAFVLPGAYVQLGGIEDMSTWKQLKVYCAGAWHNLVSAILALIAVGWLPALMSGLYLCQEGAMVVTVPDMSPLSGHVEPGDIIVTLGRFAVEDGGPSFRGAVSSLILSNDSVGFCVPEDLYRNYSKVRSPCCQDEYLQNVENGAHLGQKCFRVQGIENRTSCLDPVIVSQQPTCRQTRECIADMASEDMGIVLSRSNGGLSAGNVELTPASRAATPVSADSGNTNAGESSEGQQNSTSQAEKVSCFVPLLPLEQQLVDVRVRSLRTGEEVHFFYEGYPQVLGQSVTVSSYVPRSWWIAPIEVTQVLAWLDIPNMIERLLQYFSSISLALAILNMAPVFYLDGEMSSVLFVRLFAPKMETSTLMRIRSVLVCTGTVLLILNMIIAVLEIEPS